MRFFCSICLWLLPIALLGEGLESRLEKILKDQEEHLHIGIEVVSLRDGKTLYRKNAEHLFVPASVLKLFTAGAALHMLGADYQFPTRLFVDGKIKNHTLRGNLYLKGSGDPELSSSDLEALAEKIQEQGIAKIEGDLCIDHSDFDTIAQGPGWMWDEGAEPWNAPVSALLVNHSCVQVCVRPGEDETKQPRISLFPATDFIRLHNQAKTSAQADTLKVERAWMARDNTVFVKGEMPTRSEERHFSLSIEDPHLYAAHLFCDALKRRHISISGRITVRPVPKNARPVAEHLSFPLVSIVEKMLKQSDNLIADCLFKKVGHARAGAPGTWQNGREKMIEWLKGEVSLEALVMVDGSGLSRYNLISPHHCVQLLVWAERALGPAFAQMLAISGVDGTLKGRLERRPARLFAKTGGMTGVSGLAGYAITEQGERLAFSLFINGFTAPPSEIRERVEDALCQSLTD